MVVRILENEFYAFLWFKGSFVDQWVHFYSSNIVYTKTYKISRDTTPLHTLKMLLADIWNLKWRKLNDI